MLSPFSGCTVGPKYKTPAAPVSTNFKEAKGWKVADPQDDLPRGKWWEVFGDLELNALEEQVNISNQNLAAAEAQFRAARAVIKVARADLFPTLTVGASELSSRFGAEQGAAQGFAVGTGAFYQLPLTLTYEADVWGRIRRNIE